MWRGSNAQIKTGLEEAKTAADSLPVGALEGCYVCFARPRVGSRLTWRGGRGSDHHAAKAKGNACYKLSQYEEAVKCAPPPWRREGWRAASGLHRVLVAST